MQIWRARWEALDGQLGQHYCSTRVGAFRKANSFETLWISVTQVKTPRNHAALIRALNQEAKAWRAESEHASSTSR